MRNAHPVLDAIIARAPMRIRNDAALARALEVAPSVISKIRHGKLQFGDTLLLRAHDNTGIPVRDLLALRRGVQ